MEKEYHELLIRLDTRQEAITLGMVDMKKDIKEIRDIVSNKPCDENSERIKSLERIVWRSVYAVIGSCIAALISLFKVLFAIGLK